MEMFDSRKIAKMLVHVNDLHELLWSRDIEMLGVESSYILYFIRNEMLEELQEILTELHKESNE